MQTEQGITEPIPTFSTLFGEPFMPLAPDIYAGMLGERIEKYNTKVYLVNTGWTGGPYGIGSRMDLKYISTTSPTAMTCASTSTSPRPVPACPTRYSTRGRRGTTRSPMTSWPRKSPPCSTKTSRPSTPTCPKKSSRLDRGCRGAPVPGRPQAAVRKPQAAATS